MSVLVLAEHDQGNLSPASFEALAFARSVAEAGGWAVESVVLGRDGDSYAASLAEHGAEKVHVVGHELLRDYGSETWGEALRQLVDAVSPAAVVACGTDRGNEVLAQVAARLDLPFVANCNEATPGSPWTVTRVQWGGSLLEEATLTTSGPALLTVTHHAVDATPAPAAGTVVDFAADLDESLARTMVKDRVVLSSGVTLSTAPIVVGGGRGVGSSEAFAPLEELAELVGGKVGCSRAVTNNGWRPHSDQVGQTGTRIAPDLYVASGISGAIQHWVGAKASKQILAINTDPEANMVTKANYAVIGDLHQVLPAVIDEIKRRRG